MATAKFISEGNRVDYTPSSATAEGAVVVQGDLLGVTTSDIAADTLGSIQVTGIVRIPKPTGGGTDYSVGDLIYWDVADQNGQDTADSGTNKLLGKLIASVTTAATTMDVLLTP